MLRPQRSRRKQVKPCPSSPTMFEFQQSPQHSIFSANCMQTVPGAEGTLCQPPIITGSRCSNVSASGITRFEKERVVYTWTVSGIKNWPEDVNGITSSSFRHPNSSEWCAVLTKQGNTFNLRFWLKGSKEPVKATLRAHLILGGGEKREVYPTEYCTLKGGDKSRPKAVGEVFPGTEGLADWNYTFTFECEVEILCIVWDELPSVSAQETHPGLTEDFGNLLESQQFADFVLHAGDVQLKAHKAVLSARSPVFASMLRADMKEVQENYVYIEGVEPEVVAEALRYMYTGRAPALRDMARGLLVFADRYDLRRLKGQCEVELARRLTVENAAATAVFATVNSCDALQKASVAFIRRHIGQVMGTAGWKEALHSDPTSVEKISQLISAGSESKSSDDTTKTTSK